MESVEEKKGGGKEGRVGGKEVRRRKGGWKERGDKGRKILGE